MRKKVLFAAFCVAMSVALCACNKTDSVDSKNPTGSPVTGTPQPTAAATSTPSAMEQAYSSLPVSDYEDYVASTVLPEGYMGLKVDKITDEDVDVYVQEVLENNKERQLKDGAIEKGDIAIIDYTGYLDGVPFEGGSAIGHEMEVGFSGFIDGFDDGLIGAKKGESRTLNLTFPVDYYSVDLAGKAVVFEVRINSVAAQVLPEFTDEFVTELTSGEYTTTADFRAYAKGFLTEERKYAAVMDYLVDNATFGKLNEEYIQAAFELEKQYYAYMYGFMNVEEFEELFGAESSEVLWAMVEKQVRRYEQDRVVLYCVAKA
ncbi:MAG: FKBP-type peptidyl-prolyl cis-trans isomerase, partial [Lachnospiraceae bacterium]|nr:FKBP-type peptidyl-prolyl cis-trans isomerase [Lachnospiraceae bacterium]